MDKLCSQKKDFNEWYNNVIKLSDLAEVSASRGCIIIKPYGYSIWEKIQNVLNDKIKKTNHKNAYFPMLIPKSFFAKESSHVSGFAKECAIITHSRLKEDNDSVFIDETSKLEEEYIIRPTSESIIWNTYRNWIHSYRDLPLKINQWCNVCRWEMRTRPFLRTSEFLWQEGHTAHVSREEAFEEVMQMLDIYYNFGKDYLAIPFIKGRKTENEKFAGADETYTIEAIMKDGKALQCGTSHLLGQHFSKAFDVKFLNDKNEQQYVWGTSWGISTRLIGAIIMTHGDDKGLVLPPKIAPIHVVIIPIFSNKEEINQIKEYLKQYLLELQDNNIDYVFDISDDKRPGYKFNDWEIKGVPIQIRVGIKDMNNNNVEIYRRDINEKENVPLSNIFNRTKELLKEIQNNIYKKALDFKEKHTFNVDNYDVFKEKIKNKEGFIIYKYQQSEENKIKEETSATVRCQPINDKGEIIDPSTAIFSQSY